MSEYFSSNASLSQILIEAIPDESANSMTIVERYHQPIRRAFNTIRSEAPKTDAEFALQMAVKSINDSVRPDGLVPTVLVYGALPLLDLPHDQPTPSMIARATALRKATTAMSKHFARRQVRGSICSQNGSDVSVIHATPVGG